jgi:hypothetical protein
MKTFSMLLVLAAGSMAAPAFAHADKATPDGADKPKKERKICRSDTKPGSHMARTVCKTAKEWNAAGEETFEIPGNREASGNAINIGTPIGPGPR